MAFAGLLPHQAVVTRRSGRIDRFRQPVDINPRQNVAGETTVTYPCRAYQRTGGLSMEERMVDTFVKIYRVYTTLDAEIHEDDGVKVVDPNTGRELFATGKVNSGEVVYDATGPHHQEFDVWIMSGPN